MTAKINLTDKARQIRKMTLDTIGYLGVGHIGRSISVVEMLAVLFCVLADLGFFQEEWLHTVELSRLY